MKTQKSNINQLTAFEAVGNAMVSTNPNHYKKSINPGSIVMCRLSSVDAIIEGLYVITTTSGGVHLNNIVKAEDMLILHSLNQNFAPGVLALNEVTGVYKVVNVQTDRELIN